jgi:hypothetical protein
MSTMPLSPKDIQGIQDDLTSGNLEISQLPAITINQMEEYWASNPNALAGTDPDKLAAMQATRASMANTGSFMDNPFFKPIEWVGSKLYTMYSNSVSPVLTAGFMALHDGIYDVPDSQVNKGGFVDYWDSLHNVSPGQAIWMLGMNNEELKKRGLDFADITKDAKAARAGKYHDERTVNDPTGTLTRKEEYFDQGAAKYVTGTSDLAVSFLIDPLVIAGKGAGALRAATYVKPVSGALAKANKGLKPGEVADFDKLATSSNVENIHASIMKIKAKNPDTAALAIRRDFSTIRKSANGDNLSRLLAQAKDGDEVMSVLRISMGDVNGYMGLESKNMALAYQANAAQQRLTGLGANWGTQTDAWKASPHGQRIKGYMDQQETLVNKLNADSGVITDKLAAFNSIESLHYNKITSAIGMKLKGSSIAEGQLKSVRGQGVIKGTTNLVYNTTIGAPIKVARSYNDIKPTAFIDIHGENSYLEVLETLKEAKVIDRATRDAHVSRYLEATPNNRSQVLMEIEKDTAGRIADKYGVERDVAHGLYDDFAARRFAGQQSAQKTKIYGTASLPDPNNPGLTYRAAEIDSAGGVTVATPIFDTQLANNHAMMDFGVFETLIKNDGKSLTKLRNAFDPKTGGLWYHTSNVADVLSTTWKFAQLFRLGYAPRALADDFLGQVARYGTMAMIGRTVQGAKTTAHQVGTSHFPEGVANRVTNGTWTGSTNRAADEAMKIQHDIMRTQLGDLGRQRTATRVEIEGRKSVGKDATAHEQQLADINDEIFDVENTVGALSNSIRDLSAGDKNVTGGRQLYDAAFGGSQGGLYKDLTSGKRNFANMMGSSSDWYLKQMRRGEWEEISTGSHGIEKHGVAWARKINDQIAQSSVGRQVLMGKSENEIAAWMRVDPEGIKYRADIGLKHMPNMELAKRVKAEVDHTMNPSVPGMDTLRQQALEGTMKLEDLLEAVPSRLRPSVNAESFKYADGTNPVAQLADRAITGYYNLANQIPATKLLRNPLFAAQYKASIAEQGKLLAKQGVHRVDDTMRKTMEETARRQALQDVKNFTFTMDHETKMAFHMRHFGAFFGAQSESWNRWARIIAEKPETLGRIGQVYGAPARVGMVVDGDGQVVDAAGQSTDPLTGEKKLTKYSDRKILFQVPEYLGGKKLNKALGLDENAKLSVPMSSLELVLNHGDGALPVGAGPYVQIGVNHFAQEDPKVSDWAQKMGVLPFGPQDSVLDFINPNTGKRLGDSNDDMGETKQRALLYMMQAEHFKFENGMRDTEPTWTELKDRADRWTMFRTVMAFTLPVSVNGQDPYQFFRDEFNRMQKVDPVNADEAFHDKYGDSFFGFSQSMSKNNTGLRPTAEGVKMSKYYSDLINKVGPEYAGLVVGEEGDGEFSQGAYYYQKNHSTDVAGNKTDRTALGAREAYKNSKVSLGWVQYRSAMDEINAQLFDRGLASYDDAGAEDLKATRDGVVKALSTEKRIDGTDNEFYNAAWVEDFKTLDGSKYDRRAAAMRQIVDDPELWAKAYDPATETVGVRSDMFSLKQYLIQRGNMNQVLADRKAQGGSADITANTNADLLGSFTDMTMRLVEQDTKFGRLHSMWFSTDMGYNQGTLYSPEDNAAMDTGTATQAGMYSNQDLLKETLNGANQTNA